jgi:hypothetical protein
MKVSILRGRTFDASDDFRTSAIISAWVARELYGTIDVIGNGFPKTQPKRTIIGVVADTRLADVYVPLNPEDPGDIGLAARANTVDDLVAPLRDAARNATRTRSLPLPTVRLLKVDFYERAEGNRGARILTIAIALLTLAVACLGILGLVSFGIKVRRKEIAIRIALGAGRRSIALALIRRLVWPVALGMFIGIAGTRIGAGYLVQETLIDGIVMTSVASIVLVTTAGAALLPGLRASRGNSLEALRCE